MSDLISRADAIEAVEARIKWFNGDAIEDRCKRDAFIQVLDEILTELPSADAESDDLIIKGAKGIQDGLYNIKDGKLFKYKANGGTVRTYPIVSSADRPTEDYSDLPDIPRAYYEKIVGNMAHEINMLKEQLESADAEQKMTEEVREALMRLTMCAREECYMCKYKDKCDFEFQYNISTDNMNTLADALMRSRCEVDAKSADRELANLKEEFESAEAVSREFYEDAVKANHGLVKENSELKAQLESASDAYMRGFDDCKRAYEIELARSADVVHESCEDCPLYDKERHNCPRFNKVIPRTIAETVQGWIPCSERLPNAEDCPMDCMVTRRSKYVGNYTDMAVAEADGTWTHEDWKAITINGNATCISTRDADIIAWMPLPKPYKGGEDE